MWRWLALGAYAALLYGLLPYGPAIGRAVQDTAAGRYGLGSGAVWIVVAGSLLVAERLRRRGAPLLAYALAGTAAVGYAAALLWLRAIRLERVHLPEYGIAAWLAWRAVSPALGTRWPAYVTAAAMAAAIGWGDELVQAVTPGRFYDLRDVAANALGATLGTLIVAAWHIAPGRAGTPDRPSAPAAGPSSV